MIPLNEYVVVELDKDIKNESEDGLVIPDTAKKKPYIGTVVESSEEIRHKVKKGDIIVWPALLGVDIEIEGKNYIVLKLEDILMRLN